MTRAEYKQARKRWDTYVLRHGVDRARCDLPGLVCKIVAYEWAHGLRYVVWRVRSNGPWSQTCISRSDAYVGRAEFGGQVTRAVRKPAGSP